VRIAVEGEAQLPVRRLARIVDADSLTQRNIGWIGWIAPGQAQGFHVQDLPIEALVDPQRLTEFAGPARQVARSGASLQTPIPGHLFSSLDRFSGADQNRFPICLLSGHSVQTVVHAVDEVDIGNAPWTVERFIPRCPTPLPRVTRTVACTEVRLCLDDAGHQPRAVDAADQKPTQKIGSDLVGRATVELPRQGAVATQDPGFPVWKAPSDTVPRHRPAPQRILRSGTLDCDKYSTSKSPVTSIIIPMSQLVPPLFASLPEPLSAGFSPDRPWDLLGELLDEILAQLPSSAIEIALTPDAHLIGDRIAIGAGTRIYPGAVIEGPVWIGRDVQIRPGAYLRPGNWIGDGCIVGTHTEVKRSVFLPGARAPHKNYVGDSVLGSGVNLGAGTVLANFRHDGSEIRIPHGGERLSTGRRKLGAVLGDGVLTGCGAVLHPGVVIGQGSQIYPGVQLRPGLYPANSIVKLRQQIEIVTRAPEPRECR